MKTAICGVWHVHASDYTKKAMALTEVIGVYDENPIWRKDFCAKFGLKEFETFEELLASDADGVIVYHLHVASDDMGRVIGKQGRIAKAIRTVMRAGAGRQNQKIMVEID